VAWPRRSEASGSARSARARARSAWPASRGRDRRRDQAAAALGLVAGELGGPLQGGRGRGMAAAPSGPVGRALQLGGRGLVGPDGGRGQVPGPLVGGVLTGQHVGQGPVGGLPAGQGGGGVGGRADQGVAELEPALAGPDQPGRLGRVQGGGVDAQPGTGPQHHRRVAGGLGRRHHQQGPGLGGQAPDPLAEGPLQPGRQRQHVVEQGPPGELAGGQRPGQLQQGQRVAAGPLDQQVDRRGRQVHPVPGQQGRRRLEVQPLQAQLGQAGGGELAGVAVAGREQAHHPLGLQPPGGEPQRLRRRPVQPLGLVDQAQHRPLLGRLRQHAEHRHRDQEAVLVPVRRGARLEPPGPPIPRGARLEPPGPPARGLEPEGAAEGGGLRLRDAPGQVQHGPQQLVQGGERKLGLGLDPGGPQHGHPLGPPGGMVEQRGLADTGLAPEHQGPAAGPAGVREQPFEGVAFGAPAVEHYRDASRRERTAGARTAIPPASTSSTSRARPSPTWSASRPISGGPSRKPP